MGRKLFFIFICFVFSFPDIVQAQCGITLTNSSGSTQPGTLTVSSSGSVIQRIRWYRNGALVHTEESAWNPNAVATIAGPGGSTATQLFLPMLHGFRDTVYIGDYNHRLFRWWPGLATPELLVGNVAGTQGAPPTGLRQVNNVHVDELHRVYVSEHSNRRISYYTPSTAPNILSSRISSSVVSTGFCTLNDTIFRAEGQSNRVRMYPPGNTTGVNVLTSINNPRDVLFHNDTMYVITHGGAKMVKCGRGSTTLIDVAGNGFPGIGMDSLSLVTGAFIDKLGNIFMADGNKHGIIKWSPGATHGVRVVGTGIPGMGVDQLADPSTVHISDSGYMYVSELTNNRVQRFEPRINNTYYAGADGIYEVVIDGYNGCTDTASITISSITPPARPAAFIVSKASVCKGNRDVRYTINTVPGATGYEWTYAPATGVTINGGDTSVTLDFSDLSGNGTLRVIAKNSSGASAPLELVVTVNDLPVISTVTGNEPLCVGSTITLAATPSGGVWQAANTGVATVGNTTGTVNGIAAGSVPVNYIYTDANSCSDTATVTVTVNALPAMGNISGNLSVCVGNTVTLSSTPANGTWSTANAGIATVNVNSGLMTGIAGGTTDVTYTFTDVNACTNTVHANVVVNSLPVISSIVGSTTVCVGDTVWLSVSPAGGVWNSNNTALATVGNATGIVSGIASGTTGIEYTYTDQHGCSNTENATVTIVPLPVVTTQPSGTLELCQGDSVRLRAVVTVPNMNYLWMSGTSSLGNDEVYTVSSTGAYTVRVTSGGCSAESAPVTVTVHPLPTSVITFSGLADICEGDSVMLIASGSGLHFDWKGDAGLLNVSGSEYVAYTSDNYYAIITDSVTKCSDSTAPVNITVYDRPIVDLGQSDTSFCEGERLVLYTLQDTALKYTWTHDGSPIQFADGYFLTVETSGLYTVLVERKYPANCRDSALPVRIEVHPLPNPDIKWDGQQLHATGGFATYQWFHGQIPVHGATDSVYRPLERGAYSVTVTDTNGCVGNAAVYNVESVALDGYGDLGDEIFTYPNPVKDKVYIKANMPVDIILMTLDGRVLQFLKHTMEVPVSGLSDGLYVLRIMDEHGRVLKHWRFVKNESGS